MQYVICFLTVLFFHRAVTHCEGYYFFFFFLVQNLTLTLENFLGSCSDAQRTYDYFSNFTAFWASYKEAFVSFLQLEVQNQILQGYGLFCSFLTTFIIADLH